MTEADISDQQAPDSRVATPDGGWGWAVVIGGHLCMFFGIGWTQTITIYLVPLQEEFGSSAALLGWIVSSGVATLLLSGPVSSFSAKKLGCRKSGFIGGIILGLGFTLSAFVQRPLQLFATIGLIAGVGSSLIILSANIAIGQYFTQHHALANSIAWVGSSIGQFISAPLRQVLIDNYGWRGAVSIEGGLVFNTMVGAALFRPLHHVGKTSGDTKNTFSQTKTSALEDKNINNSSCVLRSSVSENSEQLISDCIHKTELTTEHNLSSANVARVNQDSIRKAKSNGSSTINIKDVEDNRSRLEREKQCCKKTTFFLDSPVVLVVSVVNLLASYALQVYYTYIVAKAVDLGISQKSAAFILSAYGIGTLISRLTYWWIVDRKLVTPLVMFAIAISAGSVCTFIAVMASAYPAFLAFGIVLGMSAGVFFAIMPVVMKSLVGTERLGSAYGIAFVFEGIGVITGSLMAGLIKDITGNYQLSFIQATVTFLLASAGIWAVVIRQRFCNTRYGILTSSFNMW